MILFNQMLPKGDIGRGKGVLYCFFEGRRGDNLSKSYKTLPNAWPQVSQ